MNKRNDRIKNKKRFYSVFILEKYMIANGYIKWYNYHIEELKRFSKKEKV